MKHKILLTAALLAVVLPASPGATVYTGGICSTGNNMGMTDLAVAGNSDYIRSKGARLMVHELAWTRSLDTPVVASTVPTLFGAAPMWESSMPSTQATNTLFRYCVPKWPSGAWCLVVNSANDIADFQVLRNATYGKANRIAPIFAPNSGQWQADSWSSTKWNYLRTNAKVGRGLCTDAPPYFYLAQAAGYKTFIADMIKWANAQTDVQSIAYLHPGTSANFLQQTISMTNDLINRGATPDVYCPSSYYGGTNSASLAHPIGSEDGDANQILRVARYLLDHY
jgi:hypothetical protein